MSRSQKLSLAIVRSARQHYSCEVGLTGENVSACVGHSMRQTTSYRTVGDVVVTERPHRTSSVQELLVRVCSGHLLRRQRGGVKISNSVIIFFLSYGGGGGPPSTPSVFLHIPTPRAPIAGAMLLLCLHRAELHVCPITDRGEVLRGS